MKYIFLSISIDVISIYLLHQQMDYNKKLIIFVRHAESESNKHIHDGELSGRALTDKIMSNPDPGLTDHGHLQAQKTADHLIEKLNKHHNKRVHVLVSPFTRTVQTADPFIKNIKTPCQVEIVNSLFEWTSVKKKMPKELLDKGIKNDTTWSEFVNRTLEFKEYLKKKLATIHNGEIIVIFGHSLYFAVLIPHLTSQERYTVAEDEVSIQLPNCSITCFELNERKKWDFFLTGSIHHLEELVTGHHVHFGFN